MLIVRSSCSSHSHLFVNCRDSTFLSGCCCVNNKKKDDMKASGKNFSLLKGLVNPNQKQTKTRCFFFIRLHSRSWLIIKTALNSWHYFCKKMFLYFSCFFYILKATWTKYPHCLYWMKREILETDLDYLNQSMKNKDIKQVPHVCHIDMLSI